MYVAAFLFGLAPFGATAPIHAQERVTVSPGDRVRLTVDAPFGGVQYTQGQFRGSSAGVLILDVDNGPDELRVPADQVHAMEVARGTKKNSSGAVYGAVIGLVAAPVSACLAWGPPCIGPGTVVFAVLGAGAGSLIGWAVSGRTDRWVAAALPKTQIEPSFGFAVTPDRILIIGFALRF